MIVRQTESSDNPSAHVEAPQANQPGVIVQAKVVSATTKAVCIAKVVDALTNNVAYSIVTTYVQPPSQPKLKKARIGCGCSVAETGTCCDTSLCSCFAHKRKCTKSCHRGKHCSIQRISRSVRDEQSSINTATVTAAVQCASSLAI